MTFNAPPQDWTWVLHRACPDCGYDATSTAFRDLPAVLRHTARPWPTVMAGSAVRRRPDTETWSPLEYAAHVADAFAVFDARLQLLRGGTDPVLAGWDQDRAAVDGMYAARLPEAVGAYVVARLTATAEALEATPDKDLALSGTRGDGVRFTVASLAQYFTHDAVHHLFDVTGPPRQSSPPARALSQAPGDDTPNT